jgi:small GTP-binding protein
LRQLSYPSSDIFIIAFSLVSRSSLENVKTKWIKEIKTSCPNVPVILVGSKLDLRNKKLDNDGSFVSTEEGENMSNEIKADKYIEFSALDFYNVKHIFNTAIQVFMETNNIQITAPKKKKKRSKNCVLL